MREGALQDCPELLNKLRTPLIMAFSPASANTIFAPLPPSSKDTRLTVSAAFLEIATPARVEPVKDTISTSKCPVRAVPTPIPSPLTRLNTPAGIPASWIIWANIKLDKGAISDGFNTIVHPAAKAATTFTTT